MVASRERLGLDTSRLETPTSSGKSAQRFEERQERAEQGREKMGKGRRKIGAKKVAIPAAAQHPPNPLSWPQSPYPCPCELAEAAELAQIQAGQCRNKKFPFPEEVSRCWNASIRFSRNHVGKAAWLWREFTGSFPRWGHNPIYVYLKASLIFYLALSLSPPLPPPPMQKQKGMNGKRKEIDSGSYTSD